MTEENSFRVSVAICTYNGEKYISEQLESIVNQTRRVDEIVLSDDNSIDNTLNIAKDILTHSNIPYVILQNESISGVTLNFKKAISRCSGNIIALSDQDDIWEDNKIEELLKAFQNKEVILAFSDASAIDENGNFVTRSWHQRIGFLQYKYLEENWIDEIIRKGFCPNGCLMMFRKRLYDLAPNIWSGKYMYHDRWLCYAAGIYGEYYYSKKKLIRYRIHTQSLTQSSKGQEIWYQLTSNLDAFDKHFDINVFRKDRIDIFRKICNLPNNKNSNYISEYKKAVKLYDRLINIKHENNRLIMIIKLVCSLLDGSYYYRNTNRNQNNPLLRQMKMLISDIYFLLWKWK